MAEPIDSSPSNPQTVGLQGLRILIVEDNPYIAIALEEMLTEQGLVIAGVAGALDDALLLAASTALDIALLDVNVGDRKIDPVAETLVARGKPFVFATGCGRAGLPEAFLDRPVVEKPFYIEEILQSLQNALDS
ncbi:response regulator [Methylocystis bryophila]|uniref:response regulator n=1 Tax=Methylocystis bryophila TaxID=655015 RepID=UPI000A26C686|nr:response regulator [Methylocystis bryophila]BDV36836.1 response regulator [Methylocystis bryophila]